jgi:hypothetical protein
MRRVPFLAIAVLAVLALGSDQLGASAQTGTPPAAGHGFVGAWHVATTTPFGASQSLLTLMADGTVLFSDRPSLPGDVGFPVTFIGAGHGVWQQTGPTTAAATFVEFVTDGEGQFPGDRHRQHRGDPRRRRHVVQRPVQQHVDRPGRGRPLRGRGDGGGDAHHGPTAGDAGGIAGRLGPLRQRTDAGRSPHELK